MTDVAPETERYQSVPSGTPNEEAVVLIREALEWIPDDPTNFGPKALAALARLHSLLLRAEEERDEATKEAGT